MAALWDQGTGANANLSKEQLLQFSHTDLLNAIPELKRLLDFIGERLSLEPDEAIATQAEFERGCACRP